MPKPLISVGQLIDESWNVYRARLGELLGVSGWIILSAILVVISLALYPSASTLLFTDSLDTSEFIGVALYTFTTYIFAPLLAFLIYIALTKMVKVHLSRRRPDHMTALREGKKIFIPTAITTFMVLFMLFLAILIGVAPPIIIAAIGAWLGISQLLIVGNVLLLLGMLVAVYLSAQWTVFYFFAPIVTILENTPSKKALEASRLLVKGRFWQILGRIVVPKLVFLAFGLFALTIIGYTGSIILDAGTGLNIDLQLRIGTMLNAILPTLVVVFINPLIIISDVLLYQSMKEA
jgi:hypothetical protein